MTAPAGHPLDRLSAAEIDAARTLFQKNDLLTPTTRFALLALEEPAKDAVLGWGPGDPLDRRGRALRLGVATGQVRSATASAPRETVDEVTEINPAVDGQPPI